tara:strand:- start:327 stop:659 length:333 start_codon:yes stop_codon:yes gene_type:complete
MSNLTDFFGGASSPLVSLQRGTVSVAHGATVTVTINAVNLAKSMLILNNKDGGKGGYISPAWAAGSFGSVVVGGTLTATTTISLYGSTPGGWTNFGDYAAIAYWEVIEYA